MLAKTHHRLASAKIIIGDIDRKIVSTNVDKKKINQHWLKNNLAWHRPIIALTDVNQKNIIVQHWQKIPNLSQPKNSFDLDQK